MKGIAFLLAVAVCAWARAENIVPIPGVSVVTNSMVCGAIRGNLFSSEGIPDSGEVPTIVITGKCTRVEITHDEQLRIPGTPDNAKKYYSILLLDGACLWIKDGVSPKCNVFTVGKDYPWRSKKENGDWKEGYAPGVIAFEGYGEIVTGCNKDSGDYPLCYLFLKNGIIKYRQMDAVEGKKGESQWGWVGDRSFFRSSFENVGENYKPCDEWEMNGYYAWPDSIKYELRRVPVESGERTDDWNENNDHQDYKWPNQTQFWQLNNIELHCTKWWSRGIGTDGMRLESNNHLPVTRISNNWDVNDAGDEDVTERTTYEWKGQTKYAADNSNWLRNGWTPEYRDLTSGKYYLFEQNNGDAGREVSFDKVVDDYGDEMTVGLRDSYEIRGEFDFRKDDEGALQFMGTWLQACNATNTVTLTNGLELVYDMEIYTGRGLTVEGNAWPGCEEEDRQPSALTNFPGAVTELDVRIVGGAHLPALAKYENGTLRFTGDTKDAHAGDDLWKLRIGEGLVEIGEGVKVSCHETALAPDSKERMDRENLSLELYCAPGSTLETRNVTSYNPWWEAATCKVTSTNGTVRLTGTGEYAFLGEAEENEPDVTVSSLTLKLKVGTADAAVPALTLDVANAGAAYAVNSDLRMEGAGTIRKAGPGGVKFGKETIDMLPKDDAGMPEIGFEVNDGFVDFGGAVLGESVTGPGEVHNATIAVVADRNDAGGMPLCGVGAVISKVTLTTVPAGSTDFVTVGKFKTPEAASEHAERCMKETGFLAGPDGVPMSGLFVRVEKEGEIWTVKCAKKMFMIIVR